MHITIARANEDDYKMIAIIGRAGVEDAHRASCSATTLQGFLEANYNDNSIKEELANPENIYHIIYYNGQPAGFSKIVLNAEHPNVKLEHTTKLDRIYLLKEYYNLKLGFELLQFSIRYSQANKQAGMWLFTWTGNERAVNFYKKAGFTIVGSHNFKISATHYNPNHHMLLVY